MRHLVGIVTAFALVACSSAGTVQQHGEQSDSGPAVDSALPDQPDAYAPPDAAVDSGPPRADVPAISCADAVLDVYKTPTLAPMTAANRGDIVRCAHDVDLKVTDVATQLSGKGVMTTATSGAHIYRVAFRTMRGDGSDGVSTARVYLPTTPKALPLPVIVIGHPTDGIADSCAPSMDPASNEELALPWAAIGYAAIVPDYAGLGNGGNQSYLDNRDQGQTILDGARALRKMLSSGALNLQVFAAGYSQGGGAVLSAQALASTYGCDGILKGVAAFAPEWPTRLNSFGYVDMLRAPTDLTISTGISKSVVAVMREYAYFENHLGLSHAGDGFPASDRSGMTNGVQTLCQTPLGGYVQATALHLGDLVDDTLRTTLLDCIDGKACVEPGKSFYGYLKGNFVTADKAGAPVLFVQGLADQIMVPAQEAACNLEKLQADGVTPQVCTDVVADHETVTARNIDFVLTWAEAVLGGQTPPACAASWGIPACSP